MEIFLNNRQRKFEIDRIFWNNFIEIILNKLKIKDNSEISITFVNNTGIRKLNNQYRNIDKPTDVLSFPFDNSFNLPVNVLGDIVISVEKASLQADEFGHSLKREIGFLIVHGLLHLLGYDHETPEQEKEMIKLQKKLLQDFDL